MKTQRLKSTKQFQLANFQAAAIQKDQLQHIKGGDGETPPDDGITGVEDILGM